MIQKQNLKLLFVCVIFCFFSLVKNSQAAYYYVATNGNDSNSGAIAEPWATPQKAWYSAQAGDTVYFRGGTYNITSSVGSKYLGHDGTAENPITFQNYENENVIISGTGDAIGNSLFVVERNYYHIKGINFSGLGFSAEGAILYFSYDAPALAPVIENCTFVITSTNSADNVSAIRLNRDATGAIIKNNFFNDQTNSLNGVQIFRTQGIKIENNEFQNCGNGIFLKHSNALVDTEISFSKNYIHDCTMGIRGVPNYAHIENNLIVNGSILLGDDGGVGDGYVGADYNMISHNTILNGNMDLVYQTREEDPNKGCLYNVIINNIITNISEWHAYDDIISHNVSDYNIYPIGNIVTENYINYNLSGWKSYSMQDNNSLSGVPTFLGGGGISGYALSDLSIGFGQASDGKDIGVDILEVGMDAFSSDLIPPNSPSGLNVL